VSCAEFNCSQLINKATLSSELNPIERRVDSELNRRRERSLNSALGERREDSELNPRIPQRTLNSSLGEEERL
jgi:hypothetical protein